MVAPTLDAAAAATDHKYRLHCPLCGWSREPAAVFRCERCAGALEAEVNLDGAAVHPAAEPELTYFDLLPLSSADHLRADASRRTPCRPAPRLGAAIGVPQLWIKDESRQPTGSTKDRLAAVVLASLREFGIDEFVCASTGNTAISLAHAAARDDDLRGHFFCGARSAGRDLIDTRRGNTLTVVAGSYTDAMAAARDYGTATGIFAEGGFFNWARREGLKLAYLEAFDEMDVAPDVVVQAISSGMGIMAARKAATEYCALGRLARAPRFLMVQQDTCAPMVRAWREGREALTPDDVIDDPAGLASAILLGDASASYGYMEAIARASGGSIVDASQLDLIEARGLLRELEDVDVCYSSAAAVAGVRNEAAAGRLGADDIVLVNLTGVWRGVS